MTTAKQAAVLPLGLLILAIFGTANAGPLEDGEAAYARKDYATALELFRPLAEQGDAQAQYNLGVMYDTGEGVPQDYALAVKWYLWLLLIRPPCDLSTYTI